ncbi:N-formylglutamate amidohydrolase [Lactobacillus delbrueckii subsp. bulgaricus]
MNRFPVVLDLPHSGTTIIAEMADALLPTAVLANTDCFLRELYDFLPGLGFTVLENNLNRYLIDPNRDPNEGLTGDYYHLVYAKNTFGHALYQTPPSSWKINRRRGQFYQPYHQQLQKLLSIKKDTFRNCLVIIVGYHPNRGVLKTLALIIRMVLDSSYLV